MNELQVFSNPEFGDSRFMMIDGAPWAVGRDVASALQYADPSRAVRTHVDGEDRHIVKPKDSADFKAGVSPYLKIPNRGLCFINESGLYSLILSSKLPSAKRFKRWVTSEVLPALRKTGRYETEQVKATPDEDKPKAEHPAREITTDDYIRAASIVSTCKNERLPYVLAYLKQAGIETGALEPRAKKKGDADDADDAPSVEETIKLLNDVRNSGWGLSGLADQLGTSKMNIYRWTKGENIPKPSRRVQIKVVCESLLAAKNSK